MAFKTSVEMFTDGTAVPYDTTPAPGTGAGNRGIGFGEQLTAAIANRTHYALALNTDDLNTRLAEFEAGGLDAAYSNGTIGPRGGGREITKDGGAVETVSALAAPYTDDAANAHYRANATGDMIDGGGGYDFTTASGAAYGFMSRRNTGVSIYSTNLGPTAAVTLNPGSVGGDVVRFASFVSVSTWTDVTFDGMDFLEITGAGAFSGLYVIHLGGPTNQDWIVRTLNGGTPAFTAGLSATAHYYRSHFMASPQGRLFGGFTEHVGVAIGAGAGHAAALAIFSNSFAVHSGIDSYGGDAIHFAYRQREGDTSVCTKFTATGRLTSTFSSGELSSSQDARTLERSGAGLSSIDLDKGSSIVGIHDVGVAVHDETGTSDSWSALEARSTLTETVTFGIGASNNGTFAAPVGRILLPDSGGTPAAPVGQWKTMWALLVQPGSTVVKILTGTGAGGYYLLSAVNLTAVTVGPETPDEIVLTHLDGSALAGGELPTSGALTFSFKTVERFGGKTQLLPVDSLPAAYLGSTTDLQLGSILHPVMNGGALTTLLGAAAVWGSLMGIRSFDPATLTLPATISADVPWLISNYGDAYFKGDVYSEGLVQGETMKVNNASVIACKSVDKDINVDLREGLPEMSAAGGHMWRYDRDNGWWECIALNATPAPDDGALYFPIVFSGRLMTTTIQVWESTVGQYVYGCLQTTAPVWGAPGTAPAVGNVNEATFIGAGGAAAWGELVIAHSLTAGTLIALGTTSYAIRVRATQIGARVRAIKHSVRFTSIGPGGIGG